MKTAVLVLSCDAYSDLWRPFLECWRKAWPECPYPIVFGTEKIAIQDADVVNVMTGVRPTWQNRMMHVLSAAVFDYYLLVVEDLFLCERVDSRRIENIVRRFQMEGGGGLHLLPKNNTNEAAVFEDDNIFTKMVTGEPYRVSTMFMLFERSVLLDLLSIGTSVWDFEILGSGLSDRYSSFYRVNQNYVKFIAGVTRGKWDPRALRTLETMGIEVNQIDRPCLSWFEQLEWLGRDLRHWVLQLFPLRWQRGIRQRVMRLMQ